MGETDPLGLDGHLLELLLAVYDAGSVTQAAYRLGVTQSAVSHSLDRLRAITGDELFVRSGRGIAPTAAAEVLVPRARSLLGELLAFGRLADFEPSTLTRCFVVAANDLQRDALLPGVLRRMRADAPGTTLRIIPSGVPSAQMLREGPCDLVISPRPPEATDIFQKRLFEDAYAVFFDPVEREAPRSLADYLAAEHATVVHEPRRSLEIDDWFLAQRIRRRIVVTVPGMDGLAALVQGSRLLATAPGWLARHALRGLASVPVPLATPPLPMYMVWHGRCQADPAHRWLRGLVVAAAAGSAAPHEAHQ